MSTLTGREAVTTKDHEGIENKTEYREGRTQECLLRKEENYMKFMKLNTNQGFITITELYWMATYIHI